MVRVAKSKFEAYSSRTEEVEERPGGGITDSAETKDMVRQHIPSLPQVSFSVINPTASSGNTCTSFRAKNCNPI